MTTNSSQCNNCQLLEKKYLGAHSSLQKLSALKSKIFHTDSLIRKFKEQKDEFLLLKVECDKAQSFCAKYEIDLKLALEELQTLRQSEKVYQEKLSKHETEIESLKENIQAEKALVNQYKCLVQSHEKADGEVQDKAVKELEKKLSRKSKDIDRIRDSNRTISSKLSSISKSHLKSLKFLQKLGSQPTIESSLTTADKTTFKRFSRILENGLFKGIEENESDDDEEFANQSHLLENLLLENGSTKSCEDKALNHSMASTASVESMSGLENLSDNVSPHANDHAASANQDNDTSPNNNDESQEVEEICAKDQDSQTIECAIISPKCSNIPCGENSVHFDRPLQLNIESTDSPIVNHKTNIESRIITQTDIVQCSKNDCTVSSFEHGMVDSCVVTVPNSESVALAHKKEDNLNNEHNIDSPDPITCLDNIISHINGKDDDMLMPIVKNNECSRIQCLPILEMCGKRDSLGVLNNVPNDIDFQTGVCEVVTASSNNNQHNSQDIGNNFSLHLQDKEILTTEKVGAQVYDCSKDISLDSINNNNQCSSETRIDKDKNILNRSNTTSDILTHHSNQCNQSKNMSIGNLEPSESLSGNSILLLEESTQNVIPLATEEQVIRHANAHSNQSDKNHPANLFKNTDTATNDLMLSHSNSHSDSNFANKSINSDNRKIKKTLKQISKIKARMSYSTLIERPISPLPPSPPVSPLMESEKTFDFDNQPKEKNSTTITSVVPDISELFGSSDEEINQGKTRSILQHQESEGFELDPENVDAEFQEQEFSNVKEKQFLNSTQKALSKRHALRESTKKSSMNENQFGFSNPPSNSSLLTDFSIDKNTGRCKISIRLPDNMESVSNVRLELDTASRELHLDYGPSRIVDNNFLNQSNKSCIPKKTCLSNRKLGLDNSLLTKEVSVMDNDSDKRNNTGFKNIANRPKCLLPRRTSVPPVGQAMHRLALERRAIMFGNTASNKLAHDHLPAIERLHSNSSNKTFNQNITASSPNHSNLQNNKVLQTGFKPLVEKKQGNNTLERTLSEPFELQDVDEGTCENNFNESSQGNHRFSKENKGVNREEKFENNSIGISNTDHQKLSNISQKENGVLSKGNNFMSEETRKSNQADNNNKESRQGLYPKERESWQNTGNSLDEKDRKCLKRKFDSSKVSTSQEVVQDEKSLMQFEKQKLFDKDSSALRFAKLISNMSQVKLSPKKKVLNTLRKLRLLTGVDENDSQICCSVLANYSNPNVISKPEDLVDSSVHYFLHSNEDLISDYKKNNFPPPLLSLEEECFVSLTKRMQDRKHCMKNLIRHFMAAITSAIFFSNNFSSSGYASLCRLYTAWCKLEGNLVTCRSLCYSLIYNQHLLRTFLITNMVLVWPEIMNFSDCLAYREANQQVYSFLLLGKMSGMDSFHREVLPNILQEVTELRTPSTESTPDFLSENLLNSLKHSKTPTGSQDLCHLLLLLSSAAGWTWTKRCALEPILNLLDSGFLSVRAASAKLIGSLLCLCPPDQRTNSFFRDTISKLESTFFSVTGKEFLLEEACAHGLLSLKTHLDSSTLQKIKEWLQLHRNDLNLQLLEDFNISGFL